MYIHIYTYVYVHIYEMYISYIHYIYTHICIYIYIRMYMYIYVCTCIYTYIYIRRESSKSNSYIISPRVIMKAIIISIHIRVHMYTYSGARGPSLHKMTWNDRHYIKIHQTLQNANICMIMIKDIHLSIYIYIHINTHMYMHIYIYTCIYMYTYRYMCIITYPYVSIHKTDLLGEIRELLPDSSTEPDELWWSASMKTAIRANSQQSARYG